MQLQKILIKKNIKHGNRTIKSRGTILDKKLNRIKYPMMKLKNIQTLKNIKSQINNN